MTVSFKQWLSESISYFKDSNRSLPVRLARPLYYIYLATFFTFTSRYPIGTNIFDRDWDALLILDACRVDAMYEVADEYEFIESVDAITSVGSASFEWKNNTFRNRYKSEIKQTAYVTQNPLIDKVLTNGDYTGKPAMPFGPSDWDVVDRDDFQYLEELWRCNFDESSEWLVTNGESSVRHPRHTTDRAIRAGREVDSERLLVHYLYPHDPYIFSDQNVLHNFDEAIKRGDATKNEAWEAYIDHLRIVLDEVEILLNNFDGNVVLSSDHGEAFGKFGFWRHPPGCPLPSVRRVPWVETTGRDSGEYEPIAPGPTEVDTSADVETRMENLGYL